MKALILFIFILFGCSTNRQRPNEMILGNWLYVTAESLGDGSQNDKAAIAEFDKTMEGKILTFYKDRTYKATRKVENQESVLQTGQYSIALDGKSMTMGNNDTIKISLTDSIFKFYSPNNGAFVWRKLKD